MEILSAEIGGVQKCLFVNKKGKVIKYAPGTASHMVASLEANQAEARKNPSKEPHRWELDGIRTMTRQELERWDAAGRPGHIALTNNHKIVSQSQASEIELLKAQLAEMKAMIEAKTQPVETESEPEPVKIETHTEPKEGLTIEAIEAAGTNFQALKKMVLDAGIETDARSAKAMKGVLTDHVKGGENG